MNGLTVKSLKHTTGLLGLNPKRETGLHPKCGLEACFSGSVVWPGEEFSVTERQLVNLKQWEIVAQSPDP